MIRTFAASLLLLASLALHAATPQIFPDDYKPTTCDVKDVCASFSRSELVPAGARMQSYTMLREQWVSEHWDKLMSEIKPYCAKLATCYATAGNTSMFCNDVVLTMMMSVCDQWPEKSDDHEQCFMTMRSYALGVDLKAWKTWEEAQKCAKATASPGLRKLDITMTPTTMPPDFNGKFVIYAFDHETHVPVRGIITVEGETLFAREVPDGQLTTSYPVTWKAKLRRVVDANGHGQVVPPTVTIKGEGYEIVTLPMPVEIRKMVVTMTPSAGQLKRGKNNVTITATDAVTGKPVDARVMVGPRDFAEANQPFVLDLAAKEKRPEIRVRSSFDRYSDVVVAPAGR
jgi:hypothetical protein